MKLTPYDRWKINQSEEKPLVMDVFKQPLYEGDSVYEMEEGFVREDDLLDYIKLVIGHPFELTKERMEKQ